MLRALAMAAISASTWGAARLSGAVEVSRHVIVVGVNESRDEGVEALRFADNDAARYVEIFQEGASTVSLLAVLDAETQQRHSRIARKAIAPTYAALKSVLSRTFSRIEAERRQRNEVDLIFVYTGHGAVDAAGEGYINLLDTKLTRTQIFQEIVKPSPARFNHIVIDSCSAYFVLNRGSEAVQAVRDLVKSSTLQEFPNTGAILATSRDRATHEWTRVEGGVFSHEILSALSGAADVDADGRLRYDEVGAFMEAANQGVRDQRARVDVFLQPPRLQIDRPLWMRPRDVPILAVAKKTTGHYSLIDNRGLPLAEFNKSPEQPLFIALTGMPPHYVSSGRREYSIPDAPRRITYLEALRPLSDRFEARSSVSSALERGLYSVPFGRGYVAGYRSRLLRDLSMLPETFAVVDATDDSSPAIGFADMAGPTKVGMGIAGAMSFLTAGVSGGIAVYEWQALQDGRGNMTMREAMAVNKRQEAARTTCLISSLAAAVFLSGAAWLHMSNF